MSVPTVLVCLALPLVTPLAARAQTASSGEPIRIARTAGRIAVDGDLGDEGWRGATPVTKWYETNPGDSTEPKVKNVGYLAYDDRFFYAGLEFEDPTRAARSGRPLSTSRSSHGRALT